MGLGNRTISVFTTEPLQKELVSRPFHPLLHTCDQGERKGTEASEGRSNPSPDPRCLINRGGRRRGWDEWGTGAGGYSSSFFNVGFCPVGCSFCSGSAGSGEEQRDASRSNGGNWPPFCADPPPGTVPTRLPRCPQLHAHLLQDLPAPEVRHLLVQILLLERKRLASTEGGKGLANFFCKKPGS